jgi:histidinol phosphatase-like enzyme
LLQAAKELSIDLKSSMMIGDKLCDLEVAFNAGCERAALVMTGHGKEQKVPAELLARCVVADGILPAAKELLPELPEPLDI